MLLLNQRLTIPSSIAVGDSRQVDIRIDIGSDQLEKVAIASAAGFIARSTEGTGSIPVAPDRLQDKVDDVEEGVEERPSHYRAEVELQQPFGGEASCYFLFSVPLGG